MNIYINLEISSRELDSKILLAMIAANRGHKVIISSLENILVGIQKNCFPPGIFHNKSITPADHKIKLHQFFIDKGYKITSLDEEGGIEQDSCQWFIENRYSEVTLKQVDAIFGWGPEDVKYLKKCYPKYSSKIHMTGSPRVDLWSTNFSDYWERPVNAPNKPYLLISSNMAIANAGVDFYSRYERKSKLGYYNYNNAIKVLEREFAQAAESHLKTFSFIEAIKFLTDKIKHYDIVFRPHPSENVDIWKTYLKNIPNLHIIREGSITAWVNNAFAIMQNGCTTAVEATINKKPLINYKKHQVIYYKNKPYDLGVTINNLEDLLLKTNSLFDNFKNKKKFRDKIPSIVYEKLYIDDNELAAEKIVRIWENLNIPETTNLKLNKFKFLLKLKKLRKTIGKFRREILKKNIKFNNNEKKPNFNEIYLKSKISKLQKLLNFKDIHYDLLGDHTILIKKK